MTILPQLERDLAAAADDHLPSAETPGSRRRSHRFGGGVAIAVAVAIVIVVAVVALSLRHRPATRTQTDSNLVTVGMPVPVRSVNAGSASGALQLQALGPGRSSHGGVLATLLKPAGYKTAAFIGSSPSPENLMTSALACTPRAQARTAMSSAACGRTTGWSV